MDQTTEYPYGVSALHSRVGLGRTRHGSAVESKALGGCSKINGAPAFLFMPQEIAEELPVVDNTGNSAPRPRDIAFLSVRAR